MPRRHSSRRGVLLLVVLSFLMLFLLVAITFVVVAAQHRLAMRSAATVGRQADDDKLLLDDAFYQVVRGAPLASNSVLSGGNSLLEDLYGNDGVYTDTGGAYGSVAAAPTITGLGIDIRLNLPQPLPLPPSYAIPEYFSGCVLTFKTGPATGRSLRIVTFAAGPPADVHAMPLPGDTSSALPNATDKFIINGRPFDGTGIGFNPPPTGTGRLDLGYDPTTRMIETTSTPGPNAWPFALMLNLAPFGAQKGLALAGGADEDYDAPDTQNPLLAYIPSSPSALEPILPSLHRPDLVQYWVQTAGVADWQHLPIDLARRIMARPVGAGFVGAPTDPNAPNASDNPLFTGSNPAFDAVNVNPFNNNSWDVDNDGDGVPESVWVDLGSPVRTTPDGRRYKPLFAILCTDLDGRANVNAHGSWAQAIQAQTIIPPPPPAISGPFAGGNPTPTLSRGLGYGPADVNLNAGGGIFSSTTYADFLSGNANWDGRYGELNPSTTHPVPRPLPTPPPGPFPGVTPAANHWAASPLGALKFFDYPPAGNPTGPSAFSILPDLGGNGAIGLDYRGQPLLFGMGVANDTQNNPYEFNLSRGVLRSVQSTGAVDNPFTAAELEAILRCYDLDVSALPNRLRALLDPGNNRSSQLRTQVTTDSFDLPTPSVRLTDLLRARAPALTDAQRARLLPFEALVGLRLDVNRPFGNGRDDNGDGVVDEPIEADPSAAVPEKLWQDGNVQLPFARTLFYPTGDRDPALEGAASVHPAYLSAARQFYARHLYVLMMLLKGPNPINLENDPNWGSYLLPQQKALTARTLAQWAINVVDFRDRDSIMTPFEYNVDPLTDGWLVDGDPSTNNPGEAGTGGRGVVWGCERPELLITESFAFHDRRTEDLPTDSSGVANHTTTNPDPTKKDATFDQRLLPRGYLFLELYNPWSGPEAPPAELYATGGVDLRKKTPDNLTPVWRVLVSKAPLNTNFGTPYGRTAYQDRPDPDDTLASPVLAAADVERTIYFTDPSGSPALGAAGNIARLSRAYFSSLAVAPLLPGCYAVAGSGEQYPSYPSLAGKYVATIGRRRDADDSTANGLKTDITRRIELTPGATPAASKVEVHENGNNEPAPGDVKNTVAIVMDKMVDLPRPAAARRLSISEPTGLDPADLYYPLTGAPQTLAGEDVYSPAKDLPLDKQGPPGIGRPADFVALMTDGTTYNFRTLYLQRLANPNAPWDPQLNPYLTIDSHAVDLTVFNGVTIPGNEPGVTGAAQTFCTFERGAHDPNIPSLRNLWRHEQPNDGLHFTVPAWNAAPAFPDPNAHYFNYILQHSLGYLNTNFQPYFVGAAVPPGYTGPAGGFAGDPSHLTDATHTTANTNTFPWLTWNNRPFASATELMLVPKSRSSMLLCDYTFMSPTSTPDFYTVPPAGTNFPFPFSHLLNFFARPTGGGPEFFGLFEHVTVPSRFIGTETVLTPSRARAAGSGFLPPFNTVSNYRDPGRVNINTISGDAIWHCILDASLPPALDQIKISRRGYGVVGPVYYPSLFSNPFRTYAGAAFALPGLPPGIGPQSGVDATLLRPDSPSGVQPLFDLPPPFFSNPYNHSGRNPYFRFQTFEKLSNVLTTRSNVYAVWITVGYFEVTPWPAGVDAGHLDGYQLGAELGSDTGDIHRHRGFYIFDRTIPVGFERGMNHNVDQAILLKRFIE